MKQRTVIQLFLSLSVGVGFLLLAFRNVSSASLLAALADFHWPWLLAAVAVSFLLMILRAWRWQLELRPLEHVPFGRLWAVTSVAYTAINLIPARLGEIVRPWLIAQFSGVRMSQAIGTLVVEKLMDSFCIVTYILAALLFTEQLPAWARRSAIFPAAFTLVFAILVALAYFRGEQFVGRRVASHLPQRVGEQLRRIVRAVLEGMRVLPDGRLLAKVFLGSLFLWFLPIVSSWIVMRGFGFAVPFSAALLVFLFIGIATALPNPPAMVGPFQYACILALGIYGVGQDAALAFGLLLNGLQVLTIVAQGVVGAVLLGLTWADVRAAGELVSKGEVADESMLHRARTEASVQPANPHGGGGIQRH